MHSKLLLLCLAAGAPSLVPAQPGQPVTVSEASTSAPVVDMAEGEVIKVDRRAKRVTLRHSGVPGLAIPAGTSTWSVQDPKNLGLAQVGQRVRFRAERSTGTVVLTELRGAIKPSPGLIEIQWDVAGRFMQPVAVSPQGVVEVCGKLGKGVAVGWSFNGPVPLNFNIHYHLAAGVEYPARHEGAAELSGTLIAPVDQDYCWMWENRAAQTASLALTLTKITSAD